MTIDTDNLAAIILIPQNPRFNSYEKTVSNLVEKSPFCFSDRLQSLLRKHQCVFSISFEIYISTSAIYVD